jgi:hypothetical protein
MNPKIFLLFAVMFFLFFSCSSKILRITPLSDNTFWNNGRQYLSQSDGVLTTVICYENIHVGKLVFYLEISNHGQKNVDVDPASFYYTCNSDQAFNELKKIYCLNPETEIEKLDKKMVQEEESHDFSSSVQGVAGTVSFIGSLVSLFSGDTDEAVRQSDQSAAIFIDMEQDKMEYTALMEVLGHEKMNWQEETLRHTTLFTNQTVSGFIEFPIPEISGIISLNILARSSHMVFDFQQKWK